MLFIKRYDKNDNDRILYSEFCDAFMPRDHYKANILVGKPSAQLNKGVTRDMLFTQETRQKLSLAFNTHFRVEQSAEVIRVNLEKNANFNMSRAF